MGMMLMTSHKIFNASAMSAKQTFAHFTLAVRLFVALTMCCMAVCGVLFCWTHFFY